MLSCCCVTTSVFIVPMDSKVVASMYAHLPVGMEVGEEMGGKTEESAHIFSLVLLPTIWSHGNH